MDKLITNITNCLISQFIYVFAFSDNETAQTKEPNNNKRGKAKPPNYRAKQNKTV